MFDKIKKLGLKKVYDQSMLNYKKDGITPDIGKVQKIILDLHKEATNKYKELKSPISCSMDTYIDIWIKKTISLDVATLAVKTASEYPPNFFKGSIDFFTAFPHEEINNLHRKIYDAPLEDRPKIWKLYFTNSSKISLSKLEQLFIKISKEKIAFSKSKGFKNDTEMFIDQYKMPNIDYVSFLKNIDSVIKFCNLQLPKSKNLPTNFYSEFSSICYICNQKQFPFNDIVDVQKYFENNFKLIKKFKNKINIVLGDKSEMANKKEDDSFLISILSKQNNRHKMSDLIHEFCHVENYLEMMTKNINPFDIGRYIREKEAIKLEFKILKKYFPDLFRSMLGSILSTLQRVLFELELSNQSNMLPNKLYAKCFNRCYLSQKQESNFSYLVEPNIVFNHYFLFPYAVAYVNILSLQNPDREAVVFS